MCFCQRGCSPLHFAVRRRNVVSAIHLLGAGCRLDSTDMNGETPLHSAARDGLLPVVQTMCAYGCSVDVVNKVSCFSRYLILVKLFAYGPRKGGSYDCFKVSHCRMPIIAVDSHYYYY